MTPTPDPIKTIESLFVNYRIKCDVALSELKDGFYTQKEYEKAIKWELDHATQAINNELTKARENTGMKYANGEPILLGDTVDVPYITPMGDLTDDIDEEKRAEVVFDKGLFGLKYPYHVTPLRDYCRKTKGEYISNYGEVTIWSDNTVLVKAAIKSSGGVTPPIQQSQTEGGE